MATSGRPSMGPAAGAVLAVSAAIPCVVFRWLGMEGNIFIAWLIAGPVALFGLAMILFSKSCDGRTLAGSILVAGGVLLLTFAGHGSRHGIEELTAVLGLLVMLAGILAMFAFKVRMGARSVAASVVSLAGCLVLISGAESKDGGVPTILAGLVFICLGVLLMSLLADGDAGPASPTGGEGPERGTKA